MCSKFYIILKIKEMSGWSWSDVYGAGITPELSSVWTEFVKKNKGAACFENKGWPHFNTVLKIIPTPGVKGAYVFYAGDMSTPADPLAEVQDAEASELGPSDGEEDDKAQVYPIPTLG